MVEQTRDLYRDTATTIDLRESMRLHSFSMKHFLESIKEQGSDLAMPDDLIIRFKNTLLRLEYYDLTLATLLAQQENLLSLAFNTETVIQTQVNLNQTKAVNRITALGFVFLPLSFVAVSTLPVDNLIFFIGGHLQTTVYFRNYYISSFSTLVSRSCRTNNGNHCCDCAASRQNHACVGEYIIRARAYE